MNNNPYSLIFGQEPEQMISRLSETSDVMESFTRENPSQNVYLITGVRGYGKTVFMTEISNRLRKNKDWIVVELSSEDDLLLELAAELSSENTLAEIFKSAKINLSFWGFGLEVSNTAPITSIQTALTKMLESLSKHGKRLLVSIDEVVSNESMRKFTSTFQILTQKKLPIFLLMTGLYDNIRELQDAKNMTFLYRAPKIDLKALSIRAVADNYRKNFNISRDEALSMADLTRGYPFAFQVLGYLTWENDGNYSNVLDEYRRYLEDYVYDKIWSELSARDRLVLNAIANTPGGKILDIRALLNIDTNQFNPYRKRLINKGLITGEKRGYVSFCLPFFESYVIDNYSD